MSGEHDRAQTTDLRERLSTCDLPTVRNAVTHILCPHEIRQHTADCADVRLWASRLRDTTLIELSFGVEVEMDFLRSNSFYALVIPLGGSALVRTANGNMKLTAGQNATVVAPKEWESLRLSADAAVRVLRIEGSALQARMRDLLGAPLPAMLRFDAGFATSSDCGKMLAETVAALSERLRENEFINGPATVVKAVENGLVTLLLFAAGHNYDSALSGQDIRMSSRLVTDTVDLMRAHPEWQHTLRSLARTQGVSARTLERAFQRDEGVGPMAYLRAVRLDGAYNALQAASPGTVSVGEVAFRYGYSSHSQFSADYRRRYGESPSATLRR